jgi:uncharacterized protein with gpF-like domain
MLRKGEKVLRPVHPNAGITALYRARLEGMIEEMAASYLHWLRAQYRAKPPEMAQDATPAQELQRELRTLGKRWERRWNAAAPKLADWFAKSASRRSQAVLMRILKEAGIAVEFQRTDAMKDAFDATVFENVSLIKSIPANYHAQVTGIVMRSVAAGRDLATLAKEIEARYPVTKRRAALIARDQNNKATAVMTRARQAEVGITKAIWLHSQGGKEPRPTHLANTGKTYDPAKGWFDPDPKVRRRIWPGELINCRCVSRSVVKGFT